METVLAENVISLTNVELADVRLLPFTDHARPYISTAPKLPFSCAGMKPAPPLPLPVKA